MLVSWQVFFLLDLIRCGFFEGLWWLRLPEGQPSPRDWNQPRLDLDQERDLVRHRLQVRAGQARRRQGQGQQLEPDWSRLPAEASRRLVLVYL